MVYFLCWIDQGLDDYYKFGLDGLFSFPCSPHLKDRTQVFQLLLIQLPHHFLRSIHCERGTRRAPWPKFPLEPRAGWLEGCQIPKQSSPVSSSPLSFLFGVFFLNVGHSAKRCVLLFKDSILFRYFFYSIFIFNSFPCY